MTTTSLASAHVRHVLLGGSPSRASRGRLVSAGLLTVLLAASAALAAARPAVRDEVASVVVVLPATLVLSVAMAVVVVDQTGPRGLPAPLLVLPVSRRSAARVQRAPGLVTVAALSLLPMPAAAVALVVAGLGLPESLWIPGACVVAGLGIGLTCSVLATWFVAVGGRRGLPSVLRAPVAMALWLGWAVLGVSVVSGLDGPVAQAVAVLTGWPRILDVMLGSAPAASLAVDVAGWTLAVALLSGATRPDPGAAEIWWRHRFRRAPMLVLGIVRVVRARPTQAHLLMGACLVLALGAAHLRRPDLGPASAGVAAAAMLCAVCAVGARGLDGAVPLEVRWWAAPWRHALVVVGATAACTGPVVVLGLVAAAPPSLGAAAPLLALCLTAIVVGAAVGAVLAAPAGDPAAELAAVAALVTVAVGAHLVVPDGGPVHRAALLSTAAVGALLVAVRAQSRLDRRHRRSPLDHPRRGTR